MLQKFADSCLMIVLVITPGAHLLIAGFAWRRTLPFGGPFVFALAGVCSLPVCLFLQHQLLRRRLLRSGANKRATILSGDFGMVTVAIFVIAGFLMFGRLNA